MSRSATWRRLAPSLALIAAAVALRSGVGSLGFIGSRELFRDEAASWTLAQYPVPDLLHHAAGEPYPPLYAILLKVWTSIAGDAEWALRSLSVVAGVAIVLVAWRWASEAIGRHEGFVAGTLVAISPIAIANSRDARMYALEAFFVTAAWFLIFRMLTSHDWTRMRLLLSTVLLALMVSGELWTLALGLGSAAMQLALCLAAAAVVGMRPVVTRQVNGRSALYAAAACCAGLASFAPWVSSMLSVAGNGQPFWTGKPVLPELAVPLAGMTVGVGLQVDSGLGLVAVPAVTITLGFMLVGAVSMTARPRTPAERTAGVVLLVGAAFVPAVWLVSQIRPVYDSRYLLPGLIPMLILAAAGAVRAADALSGLVRARPGALGALWSGATGIALRAVLIGAVAVPMIVGDVLWLDPWTANRSVAPTRAIVDRLRDEVQPGDVVLAVDARSYFATAYYAARLAEAGTPLPCRILAWEPVDEPFYYGRSLIDTGVTVRASDAVTLGLRAALPDIGPSGRIWLVATANGRWHNVNFDPMNDGRVIELDRQIVTQPSGDPGQIVLLAIAAP